MKLSDITFVKRIAVGGVDGRVTTQDVQETMAMLNRCLHELPRGKVIAVEQTPCIHMDANGSHVFQLVSYHVGFARKPAWLDDDT